MELTNYAKYLEQVYHGSTWDVQACIHGSTNQTVRATKTSGQAGPPSLILKHALPYFDDEGHKQPFSIKRQEVEKTITELWSQDGLLPDEKARETAWNVPQILLYDHGQDTSLLTADDEDDSGPTSTLHVQDLGDVFRLKDALGDWSRSNDGQAVGRIRHIAFILGTSLAHLHSRKSAEIVESRPEVSKVLAQNLTDDVVWYLMMERLPSYLSQAAPDKAAEYNRRLIEDTKLDYPSCLMHGDFNFGNILLHKSGDQSVPFVIDWEFATSNGRGANGDVPEFLGMLHCLTISGKDDAYANLVRLLCREFCRAYGKQGDLKCAMRVDDLNTQLYRSAMLLVGRNMLTFAHYNCSDDDAFDDMVAVALWYFEHAGRDISEFVSEVNADALQQEDERFLHILFSSTERSP